MGGAREWEVSITERSIDFELGIRQVATPRPHGQRSLGFCTEYLVLMRRSRLVQ